MSNSLSTSSKQTARLLMVASVVLLALVGAACTSSPSPQAQATALAQGQATGIAVAQATSTTQAQSTATAQAQASATANAQATAIAEVQATAAAQAKATAVAQVEATATAQAQATATSLAQAAATANAQATATAQAQATATVQAQATATVQAQATATAKAYAVATAQTGKSATTPQPTATQSLQPASETDILGIQAAEISPSEIQVTVNYSYNGSKGDEAYLAIEATGDIPGQYTPWGFTRVKKGAGTATVKVLCVPQLGCLGGKTNALWIKLVALGKGWQDDFYHEMYPYNKKWN